ncbi:major type 1 subunit fimbrin (pilin) [Luteibacter sp. Sphag1AF]|uniref:fimbrial protein n=1 Tax=Luteibacter sp. Sphag1AF TaxID=2587031 RepID=UPI00160B07D4|nr:fimbrial protein [Luteibacter sp. Sphag1AF]MBB3226980.1 major type 1 subunit fimbrin (pilin) [Luteibacter sp. Sphag1AF]
MKHIKIVSAIVLTAGIVAAGMANAATIGGGTITFYGTVKDNTCSVVGGPGTNQGRGSFEVRLDDVNESDLAAAGDTHPGRTFSMLVGSLPEDNCDTTKLARLSFQTLGNINPSTGALENIWTGLGAAATNVNIQLTEEDDTPINLARSYVKDAVIDANGEASFVYKARYLAAGGAATSGQVKADLIYSVDYN